MPKYEPQLIRKGVINYLCSPRPWLRILKVKSLTADVSMHGRVPWIRVAPIPARHSARRLRERDVKKDRVVPPVCLLLAVQKHPFDQNERIVRGKVALRSVAVLRGKFWSIESVAASAQRLQHVLLERLVVVGIQPKSFRRIPTPPVPYFWGVEKIVNVDGDNWTPLQRWNQISRKG